MKIKDFSHKPPLDKNYPLEKQPHIIKGIAHKQPSEFQKELDLSQKKHLQEKLKILLVEIDESGKKLARLRTVDILTQYKELIKTFLKEVTQNLYQLKEESHFDAKGKHKVLVLVKSINKSLEELVKMVLDKEVDNLRLLEKVGEIKGMLIDLYS
jgi:uncharacterized protein YaaR (DUF327 family)